MTMIDICAVQPPGTQGIPIVSDSPLDSDQTLQLTLTYNHDGQAVQSNTVTLNLKDAGEPGQTYTGDQRAKLIGTEIDPNILPGDPQYGTYKWSATNWLQDGTLNGGVAEADFADVIRAGGGNDKIDGKGGNDALSGGAGKDQIDGGSGDDLIAGGAGSDSIKGGDGNDFISSSAGLRAPQRRAVACRRISSARRGRSSAKIKKMAKLNVKNQKGYISSRIRE